MVTNSFQSTIMYYITATIDFHGPNNIRVERLWIA